MPVRHETRVRVRFNEVDPWGMVWYANYFAYVEECRAEIFALFGLRADLLQEMGYIAPIVDLSSQFKSPARFGDELVVRMKPVPREAAMLVFDFEIVRPTGELVMRGRSSQVLVDARGNLVYRIPEILSDPVERMMKHFSGGGA